MTAPAKPTSSYLPSFLQLRKAEAQPEPRKPTIVSVDPFDATRPGTEYRLDRALAMAELSALAYNGPTDVEAGLKKAGFTVQSYYSVKGHQGLVNNVDTQCYVATKGDLVVLSFRGTDSLTDAATDIAALFRDTVKVGNRELQVHRGFSNALAALEGKAYDTNGKPLEVAKTMGPRGDPTTTDLPLREEVRRLVAGPPQKKLYITGHSLGAGLATIEAFNLAREGVPIEAIYTIGSPRVGDPAFQDEYNKRLKTRTFRHVNYSDVVTRVPFDENYLDDNPLFQFHLSKWETRLLNKFGLNLTPGLYGPAQYRHVGTEKYLTVNGQLMDPPPSFAHETRDWFKSATVKLTDTLANHRCGNYITILKNLSDQRAVDEVVDSFMPQAAKKPKPR